MRGRRHHLRDGYADCETEGEYCLAGADNDTNRCGVPETCEETQDSAAYCEEQMTGTLCLPTADDPEASECRAPSDCSEAVDPVFYCEAELADELIEGQSASCDESGDDADLRDRRGAHRDPLRGRGQRQYRVWFVQLDGQLTMNMDISDAGADIAALQLLNAGGEVQGWGRYADYRPGTDFGAGLR